MKDSTLREALEHMANDLVIELKKNLPVSLHAKVVGIVQQELRNSLAADVSVEPERVELRSAFEYEIYQCDEPMTRKDVMRAFDRASLAEPASDLRAKLESLRELSEKATAGPWIAIPSKIRWHGHKPIFADGLWHIHPEPDPERLPICEVDRGDDHDDSTRQHAQIEAEFIVACVNAIRAILEGKD